jgi:hypothetical protein
VVYRRNRYDKLGNKLLIRDFKIYYFGSSAAKLTRKQCWDFFDDETKFFEAENMNVWQHACLSEWLPADISLREKNDFKSN